MNPKPPPVVAIDGPSGSGKGAVSQRLATKLGWRYLDSGSLYRMVALAAARTAVPAEDAEALAKIAAGLDIKFLPGGRILLGNEDVSDAIRSQECSRLASQVAALAPVRRALLQKQHNLRQPPGLVADGRDMGTIVFPDALFKVFLTANPEVRAARRYKQLKEKGFDVNLPRLLGEIRERDARDAGRAASPLRPADGAHHLDTSAMSIAEVVEYIYGCLPESLK